MMLRRLSLFALLAVALAGCGPEPDAVTAPPPAGPRTFRVPDSQCPTGWAGLTVATDNAVEAEYLDDMPACTDATGTVTYIENRSDSVWLLRSVTGRAGTVRPTESTIREQSFTAMVAGAYPQRVVFVPGAKVTVSLPPAEVAWDVALPLSFGWQTHEIVADKIRKAGETAAVEALQRQSPRRGALGACTLAVISYAETVPDLPDAEPTQVLLDGLGLSASTSDCYTRSTAVATVDDAGRAVTVAEDLTHLPAQRLTLEAAHTRLTNAQGAAKLLTAGLKFLTAAR
jgi:hypothetical protein